MPICKFSCAKICVAKPMRTKGEQKEPRDKVGALINGPRQNPSGKSTASTANGGLLKRDFVGRPCALGCH